MDFILERMRHRLLMLLPILATTSLAALCLFPDTLIARNTDMDEGVYLMVARLLHRGYEARAFSFDQFWLFPKILTTSFKCFGDSLIVGRLTAFGFALAGVLGVATLIYQLGGKWVAASTAILICAINPLYIRQSRMVMADVPATACTVWALGFLFLFQNNRRRIWLALSGVCASASLMLKPFAVGLVVPIILLLFAQRMSRENGRLKIDRAILSDLLIFAAAAAVTATPFVDFFHPIDEYRRTIGFHFVERNWLIKRVDDRWRGLLGFVRLSVPLVVFAISGIAALRPLTKALLALLGGELMTIGILLAMPPWLHHYALLLPPLVVFAVLGFNRGFAQFKQAIIAMRGEAETHSVNKLLAVLFAGAVLISLIDLPWFVGLERRARWPRLIQTQPVVQYTEQNFRPDEYLISDDALILYLADRLTPPLAINFTFGFVLKYDPTSFSRFEGVVRENHVAGVIVTTRFERNPRLMSWLETNFPISIRLGAEQVDELSARVYSANRKPR